MRIVANKEEIQDRIYLVSQMILDAYTYGEIVKILTKKYNIGWRQVYRYISDARKQMENICRRELKQNLNWHLMTRQKLINKLIRKGNEKEAALILKDLADLQGYYKIKYEGKEKIEYDITVSDIMDDLNEMSIDSKKELLQNALSRIEKVKNEE